MAVPGDEAIWLWIGTAGMTLGTLAFIAMGWNETDDRKKTYYIVTTFIPAIAAVSYFSMATGFGVIDIPNHDYPVYWARYADWLFTTPLLLLDLALLAGASRNTIGTLVGLDIAMIVTGLGGALATEGEALRIAWWGISCGFFLVLLYFLVGRLTARAQEQPGEVGSLFGTLRNLTMVLWFAYPVVWLVGTEGLAIVGIVPETAIFMVLDLSAKVGFGFLLLRSHAVLDSVETETGAAESPEAA